ncbi:MAG: alpha/beta hydrolase [Gemmatimonadetes bacterium]|nr:alpha/beta hydrolase [Gemmatimonadota bacterium]
MFPRVLLRSLLLIILAYAAFAGLVWLFAERLIFLPPRERYEKTSEILLIPRADGGSIAAVHLRNPHARYTILFSHGNGEDLGDNAEFLASMRDAGFGVLAYDYSGYGLSTGRPSERAAYADVDAAYEYLTRSAGVPPERVIAHGRSLGGAVAADLASRRPVAGLVLESTFTTIFRVVRSYPLVPFDRFRTIEKLPRVTAPVLVIHGTEDGVVGFWHGRRLYELARGPKRELWVRGAGHNDLAWVAGERYWDALREFAESLDDAAEGDERG